MNRALGILILMIIFTDARSQIGGNRAFEFTHLPFHARTAALGNANISSGIQDVNMVVNNPSFLPHIENRSLAFNYQVLALNTHLTSVAYVDTLPNLGANWGLSIQHVNHGKFDGYDDVGNPTVEFSAADLALVLSVGKQVQSFSVGTNLKWAYSQMAGMAQSAILVDLASSFVHPIQDLVVALLVTNLGFYTGQIEGAERANLPFDIKIGTSFKPEHMPFRFSITAHRLYEWEQVYFEPQNDPEDRPGFTGNLFRHLIFGGELLLSKSIHLRAGYNHLIRRELILEDYGFLTGFSFGMSFQTKRFSFAYARNIYHVAGGGHTFSIHTNLNRFLN